METLSLIKAISLLIYPAGLIAICLLLSWLFRHQRASSYLSAMAIIIFLLSSNTLLANKLARLLEQQYPQATVSSFAKHDAIVVLGGGLKLPIEPALYSQLGAGSDRLLYAFRLYQAGKAPHIILSGGNVYPQTGLNSESWYAAKLLHSWGVPSQAILIESDSRTTAQNASQSQKLFKQHNINSILLVTSALHMPRSCQLFARLVDTVTAASSDIRVQNHNRPSFYNWIPNADALALSSHALHEYYGMMFNWLNISNKPPLPCKKHH